MRRYVDAKGAAAGLAAGELLIHPTAGLWGIAADPLSEPAIRRLRALKGDERAGFIGVADAPERLLTWVAPPDHDALIALLIQPWSGPLTVVVRASDHAPSCMVAHAAGSPIGGTVAVRVDTHPGARAVAAALARPFASTSLNLPGQPPALSPINLPDTLEARLDAIFDAPPPPLGIASTIVELTNDIPRVLRIGAVTATEIAARVPAFR